MSDFVRSIKFKIPGKSGGKRQFPSKSDIVVKLTEQTDGSILFDFSTITGPRGLFFDVKNASILSKLEFRGSDIESTLVANNKVKVVDFYFGPAKGKGQPKFDVGVKFGEPGKGKDLVIHKSFVLSTKDGSPLTLDQFAHVDFGATTFLPVRSGLAPAAPDARNDTFAVFEDGAKQLDSPSTVPVPVAFRVRVNDTDADGDRLVVTKIHDGPEHGTATISADRKKVIYTPFEDYSGTDSFIYRISDRHGGTDFATANVTIAAVADVPDLVYEVLPGAAVNEIIINATARQTDADSSEFIDRLSLTGTNLPAGFSITPRSVNPDTEPNKITQQFVVKFALDKDVNVPLTLKAVSEETSNGDRQSASAVINIVNEFNHTTTAVEFNAQDQSIWSTGDPFTFVDDRFLGVDTGNFDESTSFGPFVAGISGHIKLGFQSTLTFAGGEIDATSNYDVSVDTNFNKTTDQLLIDTGAAVTGANFSTVGPTGSYVLDFLYDVVLNAFAGVDVFIGSIDLGVGTIDFGSINERIDVTADLGSGSLNVLDLNSDTAGGTIEFPDPLSAFSVNFAWPSITTSGSLPPNPATADGASNNFLELDLDVDELISQLLKLPANPLDPPSIPVGPFFADPDLLDVDVIGGLNLLQHFTMSMGDLTGILAFEDGSNQSFDIGDSLLVSHASDIDAHGDQDGRVEFRFDVVPTASLHNETDLGFNIGVGMSLLSVDLGYDLGFGLTDSTTLGPLADLGVSAPIGDISVFDSTFALDFASDSVFGFA